MRRGFLNGKQPKARPAANDGTPTVLPLAGPPPSTELQSPSSANASAATPHISASKKRSDPVVGTMLLDSIPANARTSEPFAGVRIPSVRLTKSKEPSTMCIFRASTCSKITNTPGFYTPLPSLNYADVVFTKHIPNMGTGLFAKSSFKTRDVIFSERPLLIFPQAMTFPLVMGLSKEELIKYNEREFEAVLRQTLGAMSKEDVAAYMSLSNCHPNGPQLYGIARTNAFGTGSVIEEENQEEARFEHAAVAKLASRINHSCIPNVDVDFDIPTFSLRIVAQREIKAGDQLFYCYCQAHVSLKERQRQLATYGFVCKCKACVNATPTSDRLREEVNGRIGKIRDGEEAMFATPRFNVRSFALLLKLEKEMVKEGLDCGPMFTALLSIILRGYQRLNNIAREMEYFDKMKKYMGST